MGRRILNDALRTIVNAEKRNKATAELKPISTVICSFLNIMKHRGYIKDFQVHDPHRVGRVTVELLGRVNDCKALTYRQDLKARDIEQYRLQTLPTRQKFTGYEWQNSLKMGGDKEILRQGYLCRINWECYLKTITPQLGGDQNMTPDCWGYVVITTPNGVLDHEEAIKQKVGGQVLGYFH